MSAYSRTVQFFVWGFLALVILVVGGLYFKTAFNQPSPPSNLQVLSQVQDFTPTNQLGQPVTLADLKGKVWIADIIFAQCPGPCPKMTAGLAALQTIWKDNPSVKLVTLTTYPEHDTPAVLKEYAERFGANPAKWLFLTGAKKQIVDLAASGLKLAAVEKPPMERDSEADMFIHTTVSVVVDKHGRVRGGSFETLEPGFQENITAVVNQLLKEP